MPSVFRNGCVTGAISPRAAEAAPAFMPLPRGMLLPRLARSCATRLGRRAMCTSVEVPPMRLEPQLEKVISRFESSMKAGRR